MTDKDRGSEPQPNETLPEDEDLEESPEEFVEAEEEFEEEPQPVQAATASAARERGRPAEQVGARQLGSVREAHERVKVDDRLSAAFAILCAVALVGVLVIPWLGSFLPAPAQPTLGPLLVPTPQVTPAPSASGSVVPTVSPSAPASASPAS